MQSAHGGGEMKYVKEAFDSNWVAPLGPNVDAFERELSLATGAKHVAALSGNGGNSPRAGSARCETGDYVIGVIHLLRNSQPDSLPGPRRCWLTVSRGRGIWIRNCLNRL